MKTILVIDDNQEVRKTTTEILELANYKVITAVNGKMGVEAAKKEKPDLIICDAIMPEINGLDVFHVLSKSIETANIPFIFLTVQSEREKIKKDMKLDTDDCINKPFDDVELLDTIKIRLKKNEIVNKEFNKTEEGLNTFLNHAKGLKELEVLLSSEKKVNHISKKHILFAENTFPSFVYFINKGKIKTFKTDSLGNELITGLYKEGDFFGYLDILENSNYTENAVALEDTEISMIKRDDFNTLIYNNREVANKFIKMLSDNIMEREERLLKLAYQSVRKRVSEALVMLQKKYQENNEEDFTIAISRDDLSNIVGASKETVIRTLSDFKEEGLIQITGSKITIVQFTKLQSMKN